jgi:hypothetical protein
MAFSIMNTHNIDNQHNASQHNYTQYYDTHYTECRSSWRRHAECRGASTEEEKKLNEPIIVIIEEKLLDTNK